MPKLPLRFRPLKANHLRPGLKARAGVRCRVPDATSVPLTRKDRTMDAMTHDPSNETLCFGYGETKLGLVLVALSGRGVAAILFGDEPPALRRELAGAYPRVRLIEYDDRLAGTVAKVVALIASPGHELDLPLDLRGSEL